MRIPEAHRVCFIFLFLCQSLTCTLTFAQEKPVSVEFENNRIEVKYSSKASDKINKPDSLSLVFGPSSVQPDKEEISMDRAGDYWFAFFSAPEYPDFTSFYFESSKGTDKGPDNELYMVSVKKGKTVNSISDKRWGEQMAVKLKKEKINKKAPELKGLIDLEGNSVASEKLQDKILVIDFWASWCQPCLKAFPYLDRIYQSYKGNKDVKFLVVNSALGDSFEETQKSKVGSKYSFPVYYAKNRTFTDAFGVRRLPTTLIIGREGNIQYRKFGFEGIHFEELLELKIDILLGKI